MVRRRKMGKEGRRTSRVHILSPLRLLRQDNPCRKRRNRPYWCGDCRNHFSVRSGGALSHSPIPYQKWAIAIHLHLSRPQGINACQLAREIEVTHKTAWLMLQRLREGWPEQERLKCKVAEIDEAYFGGNDKNRHRNKKFGRKWRDGHTGVAGMVDRESGRVAAEVIPDTTRETLRPFAEANLLLGDTLSATVLPSTPISDGRGGTKPSTTR